MFHVYVLSGCQIQILFCNATSIWKFYCVLMVFYENTIYVFFYSFILTHSIFFKKELCWRVVCSRFWFVCIVLSVYDDFNISFFCKRFFCCSWIMCGATDIAYGFWIMHKTMITFKVQRCALTIHCTCDSIIYDKISHVNVTFSELV